MLLPYKTHTHTHNIYIYTQREGQVHGSAERAICIHIFIYRYIYMYMYMYISLYIIYIYVNMYGQTDRSIEHRASWQHNERYVYTYKGAFVLKKTEGQVHGIHELAIRC